MSEMSDEQLGKRLEQAFDSIGPTPEAEDRMLAAILRQAAAQATAEEEPEVKPEAPKLKVVEGRRPRKARPWLIALPAAACLILALVVSQGVFSKNAYDASAPAAAESVAVSEESASDSSGALAAGGVEEKGAAEDLECAEAETEEAIAYSAPEEAADLLSSIDINTSFELPDGTDLRFVLEDNEVVAVSSDDVGSFVGYADVPMLDGGSMMLEVYENPDYGYAVLIGSDYVAAELA